MTRGSAFTLALVLGFFACGRSRALAQEGLMRLAEGKQTSALELFDRALDSNANEPLALYGKGMLLAEEKITEKMAVSHLTQAIKDSRLSEALVAHARLRLAEIYALRGEREDALTELDKLAGNSKLLSGRGVERVATTYLKLKDTKHALEALSAHLEIEPQDEQALLFLMKLHILVQKDTPAALKECRRYASAKPTLPRVTKVCTKILSNAVDFTAALNLLDTHSANKAVGVEGEIELRDSLKRRGKFTFAEADFI